MRAFDLVYLDPPFNTGTDPIAADAGGGARRGRRPGGLRRQALQLAAAADAQLRRRVRRLSGVPGAARAPGAGAAGAARDAVLPHRLPRGPLLQAAARRGIRARRVPQRADLDLRLRRQAAPALARQARHDPGLRAHARGAPLRRRRGRARALHGAGAGQRREGRARQAAHRRVVSHDRAHQQPREDRLPDPEARRGAAADRGRVVAARRLVPRPVRGLGHARGGVSGAGPAVRAGRLRTRWRST